MTRLKDRTLKKAYETQTLREGTLLTEADQRMIQQIQQALEALEGITPEGAKIFDQAIEAAKQDLGKYLQGGLKQAFKNVFSDPVAKATTLANAIRTGLSQLPTIARLYLPKGAEKETQKSIWEMVPPQKQKDLLATFTKAFKADLAKGGLGGAMDLLKGNGLPYISNLSMAVQELLQNTNPQGGFRLAQQASAQQEPPVQTADQGAPQGQQAQTPKEAPAQQGQQQATAAGAKSPVAPTPAKVPQQAVQTKETTPAAKPTNVNTNRRLNAQTDGEKLKQLAYFVGSQSGIDPQSAQKVVDALARINALMDVALPQVPSNKLAAQAPPAAPATPAK